MFLISLLLASPCIAGGPKYSYDDPHLDDEVENIYHDIRNVLNGGIRGVTNASNAPAGSIGEYTSASQTSATDFPASGAFGDAVSISLTAGDWDISGQIVFNTAAVANATVAAMGISTTSGNDSTGLTSGTTLLYGDPTGSTYGSISIPRFRTSISATTTHYLKVTATYTGTTPKYTGMISARRVR